MASKLVISLLQVVLVRQVDNKKLIIYYEIISNYRNLRKYLIDMEIMCLIFKILLIDRIINSEMKLFMLIDCNTLL